MGFHAAEVVEAEDAPGGGGGASRAAVRPVATLARLAPSPFLAWRCSPRRPARPAAARRRWDSASGGRRGGLLAGITHLRTAPAASAHRGGASSCPPRRRVARRRSSAPGESSEAKHTSNVGGGNRTAQALFVETPVLGSHHVGRRPHTDDFRLWVYLRQSRRPRPRLAMSEKSPPCAPSLALLTYRAVRRYRRRLRRRDRVVQVLTR